MANDNVFVLVFSSDNYNKEELNVMPDNERYDLALHAKTHGYDETDVLSLQEFETMFNDGLICPDSCYIYFHVIG